MIPIPYQSQDDKPCILYFEAPTYAERERMLARWKFLRAQWQNTELCKRLDHAEKERNGDGPITDEEYWVLAEGCPEEDFQKQSELGLVGIDQVMQLVRGWEVNGEKVDKPHPEIIDELSRIKSRSFLYSVMGKAVREIFDLAEDNS